MLAVLELGDWTLYGKPLTGCRRGQAARRRKEGKQIEHFSLFDLLNLTLLTANVKLSS